MAPGIDPSQIDPTSQHAAYNQITPSSSAAMQPSFLPLINHSVPNSAANLVPPPPPPTSTSSGSLLPISPPAPPVAQTVSPTVSQPQPTKATS